jgi:hypothetical protein
MASFKKVEDTTPSWGDSIEDGYAVFEVNAGGYKSFWKVPTHYDSQSGISFSFDEASQVKKIKAQKVVWEPVE